MTIIPFPVCTYAGILIVAYAQTGNGIMTIIPFPVFTYFSIY